MLGVRDNAATIGEQVDLTELRPFQVVLRDGRRVRIRPVVPQDRRHFVAGLSRLSERGRYLRFHTVIQELTADELTHLTSMDYRTHMAWGAVAIDEPGEPGVGVARYVRDRNDATAAETAVTVVDDYQGIGLGTVLMETLLITALHNGIERLGARILPENRAARKLLHRLGGTSQVENNLLVAELPLGQEPRNWRSSSAFPPATYGV